MPLPASYRTRLRQNQSRPKGGQPPQYDYGQALRTCEAPRPGLVPFLFGGFVAAFSATLFFGTGQPPEALGSVLVLAFSLAMCGGWIIRQAGESAFQKAVVAEAWSLYHHRRAEEFRLR